MAKGVKLTKPTPETSALGATNAEQQAVEMRNSLRMLSASIDREILRIKNENCVRIGDSILNEVNAVDNIVKALQETKKLYSI